MKTKTKNIDYFLSYYYNYFKNISFKKEKKKQMMKSVCFIIFASKNDIVE